MRQKTLYKKFSESKQEKLRLELALEGFFAEPERMEKGDKDEEEPDFLRSDREEWQKRREAYGKYLKMRIRPAMELLIRQSDLEKMEGLAKLGWIGEAELENCIQLAWKQENRVVLLWLLHYKNRAFGFKDREFLL